MFLLAVQGPGCFVDTQRQNVVLPPIVGHVIEMNQNEPSVSAASLGKVPTSTANYKLPKSANRSLSLTIRVTEIFKLTCLRVSEPRYLPR